jgi:hypothetical protein
MPEIFTANFSALRNQRISEIKIRGVVPWSRWQARYEAWGALQHGRENTLGDRIPKEQISALSFSALLQC